MPQDAEIFTSVIYVVSYLGCTNTGEIAIVMDTSGSVQEKNFHLMKQFVRVT